VRLAIGLAGAFNHRAQRQRSTTGNTYVLGTFSYGHAAADVVLKVRGFSLIAEFLFREALQDSRTGIDPAGTLITEWTRSGLGLLVQTGMMVHRLVELVARYDQQWTLGTTDPTYVTLVSTSGREFGAGLNVYVNGHAFKIQTDYAMQWGDAASAARHLARIQLDATF
jgi:hypothetical protein